MKGMYKLESGSRVPVEIHRMYGTHGPHLMGEQRLDMLTKVTILVDASTTTGHQTGTQSSKTNTSSAIGRAVVGGILTGGVGAIVGGVTAKKSSTISSKTTQQLHTDLTVELQFRDAAPAHIIVTEISSYHWLLGHLNSEPLTAAQLHEEERAAKTCMEREESRWRKVDEEFNEKEPTPQSDHTLLITAIAGSIGIICGLVFGSSLLSKIFFAVILGGVFAIIAMAFGGNIDSYDVALAKYQDRRRAKYDELFPK